MSGTPITLSGCGKTFEDGTRALHPIDLRIEAGETIVLLGRRAAARRQRCASLPAWSRPTTAAACTLASRT
jgi:hypothetical protein